MPGYKAHFGFGMLLTGLGVGVAIWLEWWKPDLSQAFTAFILGVLFALFPDLDTDSKGQNIFYGLLAALDLAFLIKGFYKWAAILGFLAMLPALGRHRGWTHTWWAMLLAPFILLVLPFLFFNTPLSFLLPYYVAAVLGYFSHLLLDRKLI
ncbi:MAG: Membrane-bound metal-dependent hydrolase [Desulfonauticus sp. 38_4375]|nr:MAG: Membrane-bound metal-dependent hydrolase [Desulfonauticus sp. 38_4375]